MSTKASLIVLAKMAMADGLVVREEHDHLLSLLGPGETVESLLEDAGKANMEDLVEPIDIYADRFFIAYTAANMVYIDGELRATEASAYLELVDLLHLTPEDQAAIEEAARQGKPSAHVSEMVAQSSFR